MEEDLLPGLEPEHRQPQQLAVKTEMAGRNASGTLPAAKYRRQPPKIATRPPAKQLGGHNIFSERQR
jgi:hypothetical protein